MDLRKYSGKIRTLLCLKFSELTDLKSVLLPGRLANKEMRDNGSLITKICFTLQLFKFCFVNGLNLYVLMLFTNETYWQRKLSHTRSVSPDAKWLTSGLCKQCVYTDPGVPRSTNETDRKHWQLHKGKLTAVCLFTVSTFIQDSAMFTSYNNLFCENYCITSII